MSDTLKCVIRTLYYLAGGLTLPKVLDGKSIKGFRGKKLMAYRKAVASARRLDEDQLIELAKLLREHDHAGDVWTSSEDPSFYAKMKRAERRITEILGGVDMFVKANNPLYSDWM